MRARLQLGELTKEVTRTLKEQEEAADLKEELKVGVYVHALLLVCACMRACACTLACVRLFLRHCVHAHACSCMHKCV